MYPRLGTPGLVVRERLLLKWDFPKPNSKDLFDRNASSMEVATTTYDLSAFIFYVKLKVFREKRMKVIILIRVANY